MEKFSEQKRLWFIQTIEKLQQEYTQKEICEIMNLNRQHFSLVCNGKKPASDKMIDGICEKFNIQSPNILMPRELADAKVLHQTNNTIQQTEENAHAASVPEQTYGQEHKNEKSITANNVSEVNEIKLDGCRTCPILYKFIDKIEKYAYENAVLKTKLDMLAKKQND